MILNCLTSKRKPLFSILFTVFLFNYHINCFGQQPGGDSVPSPKFWLISTSQKAWKSFYDTPKYIEFGSAVNNIQNINYNLAIEFSTTIKTIKLSNIKPVVIISVFYPKSNNLPSLSSFYTVKYNDAELITQLYNGIQDTNKIFVDNKYPITGKNISTAMKVSPAYFSGYPAIDLSNPKGNKKETSINMSFDGYCPEMLVYETTLSPEQLWKVQTYFAIKYGITLDRSYLGFDGDTLWNASKREGFHHRVCAIGKYVSGGITQRISNTTYEDGKYDAYNNSADGANRSVTIGFDTTTFKNFPDKSFLLWGDDNNPSLTPTTEMKINGADSGKIIEVVKRTWLLQNAQNIQLPTRVELGGSLKETLGKDYCYLMVKLDGGLDSSDIYPLDKKMENKKWYREGVIWKNGVDSFSFGRVSKLVFRNTGAFCKEECGTETNGYLFKLKNLYWIPGVDNCREDKVVGYSYRTKGSTKSICNIPDILKASIAPLEIEFYFSGGIGPYKYQIDGKEFKNLSPPKLYNGFNIGLISDPDLTTGEHKIVLTDMTRQKSETLTVNVL